MIGRRLAGRIRAARIVRRGFVEWRIVRAERTEYLVGGDVVEAERRAPLRGERGQIHPRFVQQGERSDDIGFDERRRPVDRAIDMAFGRKVHHRIGLMGDEDLPDRRGMRDVGADQHMAIVMATFLQRVLGRRVSQLVDVDHHVIGLTKQVADDSRADKTAATGQQ